MSNKVYLLPDVVLTRVFNWQISPMLANRFNRWCQNVIRTKSDTWVKCNTHAWQHGIYRLLVLYTNKQKRELMISSMGLSSKRPEEETNQIVGIIWLKCVQHSLINSVWYLIFLDDLSQCQHCKVFIVLQALTIILSVLYKHFP